MVQAEGRALSELGHEGRGEQVILDCGVVRRRGLGGGVGGEVPTLAVIPGVGEGGLRPYQEHPPVAADQAAVVPHAGVQHRHDEIAHEAVGRAHLEELAQALPAVVEGGAPMERTRSSLVRYGRYHINLEEP